jgi:hypothetical protein
MIAVFFSPSPKKCDHLATGLETECGGVFVLEQFHYPSMLTDASSYLQCKSYKKAAAFVQCLVIDSVRTQRVPVKLTVFCIFVRGNAVRWQWAKGQGKSVSEFLPGRWSYRTKVVQFLSSIDNIREGRYFPTRFLLHLPILAASFLVFDFSLRRSWHGESDGRSLKVREEQMAKMGEEGGF